MENEIQENMENARSKILKDFLEMAPGTDSYNAQAKLVLEYEKSDVELERIEFERSKAEYQRGLDSERLEHDISVENNKKKSTFVQIVVDVLKLGITIAGITMNQNSLMKFEETGIARSKAWNFLPQIKNLGK